MYVPACNPSHGLSPSPRKNSIGRSLQKNVCPPMFSQVQEVWWNFALLDWGETAHLVSATNWSFVPAWTQGYGAFGGTRIGMGTRKPRRLAQVPLCTPQIPYNIGSNPDRRSGKSVTNRLSCGTA
jgi:hypothetical protein